MRRWIVSVFCLVLFVSCGVGQRRVVRVGVDPGFFPMEVQGREPALLGFCNEILEAVSREEKVNFERVNIAWDALLEGLNEGKYEAIFSAMQPYVFNLKQYAFSRRFLRSGPVLVVREGESIDGLKQLRGKEIGVINMVNEALLTEHAAGVIPRDVPTIAQALLDVKNGLLDGAFIERISAEGFVNDLYAGELHIVTDPIGDSGLRFVTLHDENEKWITVFNEGLKKLIHSGKYQKILDKWHL